MTTYRQTPRGIAVSAITAGGTEPASVARDLAAALATAGLPDPEVTVDLVSELPRDAHTG